MYIKIINNHKSQVHSFMFVYNIYILYIHLFIRFENIYIYLNIYI